MTRRRCTNCGLVRGGMESHCHQCGDFRSTPSQSTPERCECGHEKTHHETKWGYVFGNGIPDIEPEPFALCHHCSCTKFCEQPHEGTGEKEMVEIQEKHVRCKRCNRYYPEYCSHMCLPEVIPAQETRNDLQTNDLEQTLRANDWHESAQDWRGRLKGLEIIIEDGSLKGCLVYHEAVESFIITEIAAAEERGVKRGYEHAARIDYLKDDPTK